MLITDHIATFAPNPLIGGNIDELGVRFPDMSQVYDLELQEILKESASVHGFSLQSGVYAQLTGPSYESPAEIRMMRTLGIDAVGMSTVVEAIAARHMGLRVCGVSCISNLAAGMSGKALDHKEVQEVADKVSKDFANLLLTAIPQF